MKRFLILILAFGVPPAVYFPTIGASLKEKLRNADAESMPLDPRIEQARSAKRKLTEFHDAARRVAEETQTLTAILPATAELYAMRDKVAEAAALTGVQFTRFEADPPTRIAKGDPYQEIFVEAQVVGEPEATAAFFQMVANAPRLMSISAARMRKASNRWRTDFTITSYVMLDRR
jgi:Tfp pilus assembly protein PilO